MKHSAYIVLACLGLLLLLACTRRPSTILPEEEFLSMLSDLHRFRAMKKFGYLSDSIREEDFYEQLFRKHNVTKAQLDTTVSWYLRNPKAYERVCDSLEARFQRERDSLNTTNHQEPQNRSRKPNNKKD